MKLVLCFVVWTYDRELMPKLIGVYLSEEGRDAAIAEALQEHETVDWWATCLEG